jgi:hypothetical protein
VSKKVSLADRRQSDEEKIRRSEVVREGRVELPRPFGHRILRLVRPGTDLGATCRPVSSGVTLCHPVSFRREQDVSENGAVACTHVYVERCPRAEMVEGRAFRSDVIEERTAQQ